MVLGNMAEESPPWGLRLRKRALPVLRGAELPYKNDSLQFRASDHECRFPAHRNMAAPERICVRGGRTYYGDIFIG